MPARVPQRGQGDAGGVPFPGEQPEDFTLDQFDGLNTQAGRPGIGDQQCSWLENMLPIGPNNLRTTYDVGPTIYTAPGGTTIIQIFPFNIGSVQWVFMFLSNGQCDNINLNTGAISTVAGANTFYDGTAIPSCAQVGNSGIVIVSQLASTSNAYWAWDGALFPPGNASSPTWLGGGPTTAMPTGINGTYVETYLSRVIIDKGNIKQISAPIGQPGVSGGGTVFGGNTTITITNTDSFLKRAFTASKQANGFLYSFGDSSINVISNITTTGSPFVTTLNNQNVDPQFGTPWPFSIQVFGSSLIFANNNGVYELRGGAARKISDDLDGIFLTAALSQPLTSQPISAIATIFGIRCYMLLLSVLDPFTNQQRFLLCMWNGKKWFLGSQSILLTRIATQEIDSNMTAWGTNGSILVRLFQTASANITKTIQSKLWGGKGSFTTVKQVLRAYTLINNNAGTTFQGTFQLDTQSDRGSFATPLNLTSSSQLIFVNASGLVINFRNSSGAILIFTLPGIALFGEDGQGASGSLVGFTITSSGNDFTVVALKLLHQEYAPIGG